MARIWRERDNLPLSKEDRLRSKLNPELDLGWLYSVEVCGFTFKFHGLAELQDYADFYSQKILPSARKPEVDPVSGLGAGDHWERQTKFDELPLYLREETKWQRVSEALSKAYAMFGQQSEIRKNKS